MQQHRDEIKKAIEEREKKDKRRGAIISWVVHGILLLLIILPFWTIPFPPPGQEGILISFGMPEVGQGAQISPGQDIPEVPTEEVREEREEVPPPPPPPPAQTTPTPQVEREVLVDREAEAIAIQRQREQEARERAERESRERSEREAREARERSEREARERAEREAREQAEREARERAAREQFGFPAGSGAGQGQTGTPGNQGDPAGSPDAGQLEGLTRGTGDVGGGLSDRGVVDRPTVRDNTQKTGVVRINICVDRNGNVIGTPEYTQRGSTTSDSHLVQLSIENARKFRFKPEPMAPDRQCGHITFTYRVN